MLQRVCPSMCELLATLRKPRTAYTFFRHVDVGMSLAEVHVVNVSGFPIRSFLLLSNRETQGETSVHKEELVLALSMAFL